MPSGLELLRLAEKNWEQGEDWGLFTSSFPVEENHDGCEATKEGDVLKTGAHAQSGATEPRESSLLTEEGKRVVQRSSSWATN